MISSNIKKSRSFLFFYVFLLYVASFFIVCQNFVDNFSKCNPSIPYEHKLFVKIGDQGKMLIICLHVNILFLLKIVVSCLKDLRNR